MRENLIPSRTGPKDLPTAQAPKKDMLVVQGDWSAKVGKDVCGNWPSHLFFCLPCLLPTFTVLCKSFFVCFGPDLMNREMSIPLHFVFFYDGQEGLTTHTTRSYHALFICCWKFCLAGSFHCIFPKSLSTSKKTCEMSQTLVCNLMSCL